MSVMKAKILALLIISSGVLITSQQNQGPCYVSRDVGDEYRSSLYEYSIDLIKSVIVKSDFNYVCSLVSIYISLAAIAEGTDPVSQQKLFQFLKLPNDPCIRQEYYKLATTRAFPFNDVHIKNRRVLVLDESVTLNPTWYSFITKNSLLDVVTAPIHSNPVATAKEIQRIMSTSLPRLNLNGNSVLLDTLDYNGLWTTTFLNATIERAPFYSLTGQEIGAVDLMKIKKRARMGYLRSLHSKILELPIGLSGRYHMLFLVRLGNNDLRPLVEDFGSSVLFEAFESLRHSNVLIDVAIPRIVITTEIDVRVILEELGVTEVWNDPSVTRYILLDINMPFICKHR